MYMRLGHLAVQKKISEHCKLAMMEKIKIIKKMKKRIF